MPKGLTPSISGASAGKPWFAADMGLTPGDLIDLVWVGPGLLDICCRVPRPTFCRTPPAEPHLGSEGSTGGGSRQELTPLLAVSGAASPWPAVCAGRTGFGSAHSPESGSHSFEEPQNTH